MEQSPAKGSLGSSCSSEELGMSSRSPARRTKIKISGSTQTAHQYSAANTNQEYYSSSQRAALAASGSPRQLSETMKERLLASQKRSPQISTAKTKSRTRMQSRERPALPQVMSLNSEYFSDSSDSMYADAQQQVTTENQNTGGWYHRQYATAQNQDHSCNEGD